MKAPLAGFLIVAVLGGAVAAMEWGRNNISAPAISGMVVPHHTMMASQRAQFFELVAGRVDPETVILVSPNHYDAGRAALQTSAQTWRITDGEIDGAVGVIDSLIEAGVGLEPSSFNDEHGIRLILPDIEQSFPRARIVPIIIKSTATPREIADFHDVLTRVCRDCFMVASVDFSHYQPALLANLHDQKAIRGLTSLDQHTLEGAEVDSPGTLALLARWASGKNTMRFVMWRHTNSGELLAQPDLESTSHVFGWYERGLQDTPPAAVTFLFGGDVMFDRAIAQTFLAKGLPTIFEKLGNRVFWGTDAGLVNLEGPISDFPVANNNSPDNLFFHFPPAAREALRFLKVNAVSLANNHSGNAGREGVETTRELLQSVSIQTIGGPGTVDIARVGEFRGQTLTLYVIGVQALQAVPDISELIAGYTRDANHRVIIFPHWGIEYEPTHGARQATLAHAWIDAGADAVIGSHPHVVQDTEVYRGRPIIYSLGNFVFDQMFSPTTQQGLLVGGFFDEQGLSLFGLPVVSVHLQPRLLFGAKKEALISQTFAPFSAYRQATSWGTAFYFPLE